MFLLYFLLLFVPVAHAEDTLQLRIGAVDVHGDVHQVHIDVVSGSGSVADYRVTDLDGTDTVLADARVTVTAGDRIVVHWDAQGIDEIDARGDANNNHYIDLYSSDTDFSLTDDQAVLMRASQLIDAVVWTNGDGLMSEAEQQDISYLIEAQMWIGEFTQESAVLLGDTDTWISRTDRTSDTNTASDWLSTQRPTVEVVVAPLGEDNAEELLPDAEISNAIIISELLPNPAGSDEDGEFIEIANISDTDVSLAAWDIVDASGTAFAFDNVVIDAGEIVAIPRTASKIALNNDSEMVTVRLSSQPVMTLSYDTTIPEGVSLVLVDDVLQATYTPTPGAVNILSRPDDALGSSYDSQAVQARAYEFNTNTDTANASDDETLPADTDMVPMSIAAVTTLDDDTIVRVRGVVTAAPGMLGDGVAYIGDGAQGIQVSCQKNALPNANIGDIVEVQGVLGSIRSEQRIRCSAATFMEYADVPLDVMTTSISSPRTELVGSIVTVTGVLMKSDGATLYVGENSMRVVIKDSTGIQKPSMRKGDEVTVTGILSIVDSSYRILPRTASDISVRSVASKSKAASAPEAVVPTEFFAASTESSVIRSDTDMIAMNASSTTSPAFWIGLASACVVAAVAVRWYVEHRRASAPPEVAIPIRGTPDGDLFD